MAFYIAGSQPKQIFIGTTEVQELYLGTVLVWQKTKNNYFWNNGTQNNFEWRVSSTGVQTDTTSAAVKLVALPAYQWYGAADAGYADGLGVSTLRIRSTATGNGTYWAEVQTTTGMEITSEYKYLNISIRRLGGTQSATGVHFGLYDTTGSKIPVAEPGTLGVTNMTPLYLTDNTQFATYSIMIPDYLIGTTCHFNLAQSIAAPTASGQGCSCEAAWLSNTLPENSNLVHNGDSSYISPAVNYLFNNGYTNNISWETFGIAAPTSSGYGLASLNYVASQGEMMIGIDSFPGATYDYQNGIVNTAHRITVPAGATTLNATVRRENHHPMTAGLAIVRHDAANSTDTTNGGVFSGFVTINSSAYQTITINIPESMRGSTDYIVTVTSSGIPLPVINNGNDNDRWAWVGQVWFE